MKKVETKTIMSDYLEMITPHGIGISFLSAFDTILREFIGKTDKMEIGKCSHNAILQRELDNDGKNLEEYCRCCGIRLNYDDGGIARYNDFLVIRNKNCPGPICLDCSKNRPDVWHIAFKKGLNKYKTIQHVI